MDPESLSQNCKSCKLLVASRIGKLDKIQWLVESGADVNYRTVSSKYPKIFLQISKINKLPVFKCAGHKDLQIEGNKNLQGQFSAWFLPFLLK